MPEQCSKVTCKLISRHNIENMEGLIQLNDFCMSTSENYTLGPICLKPPMNPANATSLLATSSHAEMEETRLGVNRLTGNCSCLYPSFVKTPQLKASGQVAARAHRPHGTVKRIFDIPCKSRKPDINGYFNSRTEELDFNASIPSFNYNGQQLDDIRILAACQRFPHLHSRFQKQIGKAP